MDGTSLGEGIGALAFWGFIAALCVGGIWDGAKKREAQHETLRRMIESGKPVDEALLTKLMLGEPKGPAHRAFAVMAIVLYSVAAGLVVFGVIEPQRGIFGAAAICACLATGLLVASAYTRRTEAADDARPGQRPDVG